MCIRYGKTSEGRPKLLLCPHQMAATSPCRAGRLVGTCGCWRTSDNSERPYQAGSAQTKLVFKTRVEPSVESSLRMHRLPALIPGGLWAAVPFLQSARIGGQICYSPVGRSSDG